jgi:hypothetical protein
VNAGLSIARSRLNLANVLDEAAADGIATYVVGPPPSLQVERRAAGQLSRAFSDVCERRGVTFVDTFRPPAVELAVADGPRRQ